MTVTPHLPHHHHAQPAAADALPPGCEHRRWDVRGAVQGVGFRRQVQQLAQSFGLSGSVRHAGDGVRIDAIGKPAVLNEFEAALLARTQPLSAVTARVQLPPPKGVGGSVDAQTAPDAYRYRDRPAGFVIEQSVASDEAHRDVPPDAGICEACLRELFDPADRRYRYPFISCADCGPRASIVHALPYRRATTSMARFTPCAQCAAEYADPDSRRFHDEAISCPQCGPALHWQDTAPPVRLPRAAVTAAAACLAAGGIVAVKAPGGYRLLCDGTDPAAVALLRKRADHATRPFALMLADLRAAGRYLRLSAAEERLLAAPARPVLLGEPRGGTPATELVRGAGAALGVVLPATGLDALLLQELGGRPLTVAAIDAPDGEDALAADGVCTHDLDSRAGYGDSVVALVASRAAVLRRARGYAPAPLPLPVPARVPLLALGSGADRAVALAHLGRAIEGPPLGDPADPAIRAALTARIGRMARLHGVEPTHVVHDLGADPASAELAEIFPARRRLAVQHHHAHIASCMAEHGIVQDVIGVVYDGPASGDDGTEWGAEVMVADLTGYTRLGHFAPALEAAAVCDSWSATGLLAAAAAILGLCREKQYPNEPVAALEQAAGPLKAAALPWRLTRRDGLWVYDPTATLAALREGDGTAQSSAHLAAALHQTLVEVTVALVERAARIVGTKPVCLSGSVWLDRRLTGEVVGALDSQGFTVLTNQRVPCDDGGIAYGQAAVAAAILPSR